MFTIINFWKVAMIKSNAVFLRGVKRHRKLSRKGNNPGSNKQANCFSKPWQSSAWLVDN